MNDKWSIKLWHIASFGLFLALFFPVFFESSSVNAASDYDDLYTKTSVLNTEVSGAFGLNLDSVNITDDWSKYILDSQYWYSPNDPQMIEAKQSLTKAFNDGGRWGVSKSIKRESGGTYTVVDVFWTEDDSLSLQWDNDNGIIFAQSPSMRTISIGSRGYVYGGSSNQPIPWAYSLSGAIRISTRDQPEYNQCTPTACTSNLFVYTDHPNYPENYAGETIDSGVIKDANKLKYKITDKLGVFTPYDIDTSRAVKCDIFIDDNPAQEADDAISESLYNSPNCNTLVSHTFNEYGYYYVRLEVEFNDGKFGSYSTTFNVDGSSYEGNIDSDGNNPAGQITYEDCAVYGVDLIGGFGCQMRNFGKWLQNLIITLFVPTNGQFSSFYNEANGFLHEKLGLLLYPFDWIFMLFSSFLNAANSCLGPNLSAVPSVQPNATFFGSHVNLNVCSAEQNFPAIYNIAVFFIRTVAVLGMVLACYRKLLITLNDHQSRGKELYG